MRIARVSRLAARHLTACHVGISAPRDGLWASVSVINAACVPKNRCLLIFVVGRFPISDLTDFGREHRFQTAAPPKAPLGRIEFRAAPINKCPLN